MKLKEFNLDNAKFQHTGKPSVRINQKSGVISFSAEAATLIGLKDGTGIVILQDEETSRDWYVVVSEKESAIPVRIKKAGCCFNSSYLAKLILKSAVKGGTAPLTGNSASFLISRNPVQDTGTDLYLIITSNPLNNK